MNEIWKPIKEFEGLYEISDKGRVKSLARINKRGVPLPERIMKARSDKDGYLSVSLYTGEKYKGLRVHRLVAMHFLENPENKPEVNHKNGCKKDNHAENLEWCTSLENKKHAFDEGLRGRGTRVWNAKLNDEKVKEMRMLYDSGGWSHLKLAKKFGVSKCTAGKIIRRQVWTHV